MTLKPRILVIDDEPQNIHLLLETLGPDYAVAAATSGERGLHLARSEEARPDLILLDVLMPELNGYEVFERLRDDVRTKEIPVIFITALSEGHSEARGLTLGAVDYIAKPFEPGLVKLRIRNQLELKKYRDKLESMVQEQVEEINSSHIAAIFAMSKLAESRDTDTGQHLERTQNYCRILAEQLLLRSVYANAIDEAFITSIYQASPLHDIGKVGIPDAILCKPGKLTPDEFEIMKTHALLGAETLQSVVDRFPSNEFLTMGLDIARWHHEKWDGNGYPDGIAGEQIPLAARIMAVADVYDALSSKRCYKQAIDHESCRDIICDGSGSHFDPALVEAFIAAEEQFVRIASMLQETERKPALSL